MKHFILPVPLVIINLVFASLSFARMDLDRCLESLKTPLELQKINKMISANEFNITRTLFDLGYRNNNSYSSILSIDIPEMKGIEKYREVDYGDNLFATLPTEEYQKVMHLEFKHKLEQVDRTGGVYMDLGSGAAVAALEAHETYPKAHVVATSKVRPRIEDFAGYPESGLVRAVRNLETELQKNSDHFKYLEIDLDKANAPYPESVDLMSDVAGWTTYTFHPERPLKFVFDSLRQVMGEVDESAFHLSLPRGRFFVWVGEGPMPEHYKDLHHGSLKSEPGLLTFEQFMNHFVKGLKVTHQGHSVVDPGNEHSDSYRIVKTSEPFSCPELHIETFDEASKMRLFTIKKN